VCAFAPRVLHSGVHNGRRWDDDYFLSVIKKPTHTHTRFFSWSRLSINYRLPGADLAVSVRFGDKVVRMGCFCAQSLAGEPKKSQHEGRIRAVETFVF
jgi:hypothetical protein